jgi:hypothetical protein
MSTGQRLTVGSRGFMNRASSMTFIPRLSSTVGHCLNMATPRQCRE